MRKVADLVHDLRRIALPLRKEIRRRKAHDRTVTLRILASVDVLVPERNVLAGVPCRPADIERLSVLRRQVAIHKPLHKRIADVFQVVLALADVGVHDAHGHRAVVCPVSGRKVEHGTLHHLRDPRMVVFPCELNGASEGVANDESPEHSFCFVPVHFLFSFLVYVVCAANPECSPYLSRFRHAR